jgi:sulfur-oxidizing protein SoxY
MAEAESRMPKQPSRRNRPSPTRASGRRALLKSGGGAALLAFLSAAGLLKPARALAQNWNKAAFETRAPGEALKALGAAEPQQSRDIAFVQTPEIAENGAVVPIGVTSSIPRTEAIAILIEKNPNVLAAVFDIPSGTEPAISTRVKMAQTSNVIAVVRAEGRYYIATKEIKVTLGGCGG